MFLYKIKKITFLLLFINFSIILNYAFAYDNETTHPALTDEIVDFYNLSFPDKPLTSQQREWIIQGSILEDTPPRWINHFYDPIHKEGWSGEHAGIYDKATVQWISQNLIAPYGITPVSLLEWMHNTQLQARYGFYQGAKTWERGILEMIKGNEEEGYKILGYILHLIKDATVPEHTRNDTHAPLKKVTGDEGSPYEEYLTKYTRQNIKQELDIANNLKKANLRPIEKSSIDDYLISLAEYSNKYFFSKDTINDPKYQYPKIVRDDGNFGYGRDENGEEFILARKAQVGTSKFFFLDKNDTNILDQYFSRLSRQAILHGAGVIDLFRNTAALKKEYPTHLVVYDSSAFNFFEVPRISLVGGFSKIKNKTQSFFSQIISVTGNTFSSAGNFLSGIFKANQNFQPAGQISLNQAKNQTNNQKNENELENIQPTTKPQNETQTQNKKQPQTSNQESLKNKKIQSPQIIEEDEEKNNEREDLQKQPPKNQLAEQPEQLQQPTQKECSFNASQSPSRQSVIINEVAWMGTSNSANDEWIELKNISGGEVDLLGWRLIDQAERIKVDLSLLKRTKVSAGGFVLLERTDDDSVPNITADLIYSGALSNSNEGLRLFDSRCNLIDEVLANPDWPAGDNTSASERKTMERDICPLESASSPRLSASCGWRTSSIIGGTPKAENSQPTIAAARNSGGGGGSSNPTPQPTTNNNLQPTINNPQQTAKILINEIQIYPTDKRFIELYNPNSSAIDLTSWYIQRKTQNGSNFTSLVSKTYFENKTIGAYGYFLISRESLEGADIVLNNLTITKSNTIQIKNPNGEVVDKVGWENSGDCENNCGPEPSENQSIQRKFQNNTFIDTDNNADDFEIQTCPSPKTQSRTCSTSQSNQAPSASFVNHLLISEVYPDKTGSNFDFVELYNPTDSSIALKNYSLKILKAGTTTTDSLASFSTSHNIAAKSFFLIGLDDYSQSTSTPADISHSSSFLPTTQAAAIILYDGNNSIDEFNYNPSNLISGQSFERKAWQNNQCVSSQLDGEFLGNGCDRTRTNADLTQTDAEEIFEIRQTPNPQNSQSLPEPRNPPTQPANFSISYSSGTMELIFNWQPSQDYSGAASALTYKIASILTSDVNIIETASTAAKISINEIGRDYQFSIRAFDKDGLGSAAATSTISVPSFLTSAFFYQDPRATSSLEYLIDLYYDGYPFIAPKYRSDINGLVFYLNQENPPAPESLNLGDLSSCRWGYASMSNAMKIYYPNYSFYPHSSGAIVVLPNILEPPELYNELYGNLPGGVYQYIINKNQLEDNHLRVSVRENFSAPPTSQDYFKIAFYSYTIERMQCEQALVAVDQTKYHFQQNFPFNDSLPAPPKIPSNFTVNFNQQSENPYFSVSWATSTDPDSLDAEITYQLDYWPEHRLSDKQRLITKQNSVQINASSSGNHVFELKACDEFNLCSEKVFVSSTAVVPIALIDTTNNSNWNNFSFGATGLPLKIAQKFKISQTVSITSIAIGLANCRDCYNPSGAKISLRPTGGEFPSDNEIVAFRLTRGEIPTYNRKDFSFYFSPATELLAGDYFLVIEPEDSPSSGNWNLIMPYSGTDLYQEGGLYVYNQQTGQWISQGATDTYFRIKGFQ